MSTMAAGISFYVCLTARGSTSSCPKGHTGRGCGGAIGFVRHLPGLEFNTAVKVCLDAAKHDG
jgi:hypothetical protein